MKKGELYVIPSVISEGAIQVLARQTLDVIHTVKHFVVERARTARRFIKACEPPHPIADLKIFELESKAGDKLDFNEVLAFLDEGIDVGLLSEAGCPGIADPGSGLVAFLQNRNYQIVPLIGPSSLFLALMASGMNGQEFQFHGYLPIEKDQLTKKLQQIEKLAQSRKSTHLFIETPYRNDRMLGFLLKTLSSQTQLCIASDITGSEEKIKTKSIRDWKKQVPTIGKLPTVFLINT